MQRLSPVIFGLALLLPTATYAQLRLSQPLSPIRLPVSSSSVSVTSSSDTARSLPASSIASSSSTSSSVASVRSAAVRLPAFSASSRAITLSSAATSSSRRSVAPAFVASSKAAVSCTRSTDLKRGCVSFVCNNGYKLNTCAVIDQAVAETEGTYATKTKDKCYQHTLPDGCTIEYCDWFNQMSTLQGTTNSCAKKADQPHSKAPSNATIYATDAQGCQYVYSHAVFTVPVCMRYCSTEWASETACPAPNTK